MAFPGALLSGSAGDTGGQAGAVAFSFGFEGFGLLFAGAILAVYSFIGFDHMAQTAEKVRDVKRNLPRAMMISLGIVPVFYMLIAMALVGTGEFDIIAGASAPLVKAVELAGWPGLPIAIASLFVIVNGALTQIIAASRLLLDIARDNRGAPAVFARVNGKTDTPIPAKLVIVALVLLLALLVPLKSLAETTSFAILIVFRGVNLSLIRLKRRGQPDDVPDIPVFVPAIGAIASVNRAHRFWMLTTYATLTNYQHSLARIRFAALVFDEIQAIKNPTSLRAMAARTMNSDFCIGLTGTPIENSAVDLWAIMDQLCPGALGSLKDYRERFGVAEPALMEELHARVFLQQGDFPPLALRRLKEQVARDLPPKERRLHPRLMPAAQARVYGKARDKLNEGQKGAALKMLHHIRSVSVHPAVEEPIPDPEFVKASARLAATLDILHRIKARGERACLHRAPTHAAPLHRTGEGGVRADADRPDKWRHADTRAPGDREPLSTTSRRRRWLRHARPRPTCRRDRIDADSCNACNPSVTLVEPGCRRAVQ